MKKVAIKGDDTAETGRKIIEYLEGLGGVNYYGLNGRSIVYYLIDSNGRINGEVELPDTHTLITLPNEEFKFGDEVVTEEGVKYNYVTCVDGKYLCTSASLDKLSVVGGGCFMDISVFDTVYPVPKMQITIDGKSYTKEEAIELLTK